jgi:hypothetical protein
VEVVLRGPVIRLCLEKRERRERNERRERREGRERRRARCKVRACPVSDRMITDIMARERER